MEEHEKEDEVLQKKCTHEDATWAKEHGTAMSEARASSSRAHRLRIDKAEEPDKQLRNEGTIKATETRRVSEVKCERDAKARRVGVEKETAKLRAKLQGELMRANIRNLKSERRSVQRRK